MPNTKNFNFLINTLINRKEISFDKYMEYYIFMDNYMYGYEFYKKEIKKEEKRKDEEEREDKEKKNKIREKIQKLMTYETNRLPKISKNIHLTQGFYNESESEINTYFGDCINELILDEIEENKGEKNKISEMTINKIYNIIKNTIYKYYEEKIIEEKPKIIYQNLNNYERIREFIIGYYNNTIRMFNSEIKENDELSRARNLLNSCKINMLSYSASMIAIDEEDDEFYEKIKKYKEKNLDKFELYDSLIHQDKFSSEVEYINYLNENLVTKFYINLEIYEKIKTYLNYEKLSKSCNIDFCEALLGV